MIDRDDDTIDEEAHGIRDDLFLDAEAAEAWEWSVDDGEDVRLFG
jgi:hypothetical protein